jgi:hypothetical protein
MARKNPSFPDLVAPLDDEGSAIRPRNAADSGHSRNAPDSARPRQESSPEVKTDAAPHSKRSHSSTRPAQGSLDDRLEKKMLKAGELMRNLPQTDPRVRLLYVAVMRRDETLLDGVLAELNKSGPSR